jgi:3-oxoacyl-[acyl-carrier protein] reductase
MEENQMRLKGKTAIVTGGSRGLGKEITAHFLNEGAAVAICSRTQSELDATVAEFVESGHSGKIFGIMADVSQETSATDFAKTAVNRLGGKIDILVNNAGIYGPKGNIDVLDVNKWKAAFDVNVMSVVYMSRAVLPLMKSSRGGRILNLSGGGATSPLPGVSAYAATKTAVVRLTETMALEFKDFDIFVNAIAPGALNTKMMWEMLDEGKDKVDPDFYAKVVAQKEEGGAPLSKGAELCVYLASDTGAGVTGKLISAVWDDWGNLHEYCKTLASDAFTLRRVVPQGSAAK